MSGTERDPREVTPEDGDELTPEQLSRLTGGGSAPMHDERGEDEASSEGAEERAPKRYNPLADDLIKPF